MAEARQSMRVDDEYADEDVVVVDDAYDAIMRCRRRVFRASPCVAGWQAPAIWVWSAVAGGVGLVLAV